MLLFFSSLLKSHSPDYSSTQITIHMRDEKKSTTPEVWFYSTTVQLLALISICASKIWRNWWLAMANTVKKDEYRWFAVNSHQIQGFSNRQQGIWKKIFKATDLNLGYFSKNILWMRSFTILIVNVPLNKYCNKSHWDRIKKTQPSLFEKK